MWTWELPVSSFPVLATSSAEHALWLSFGFYLLNVLVPIIPAVIIYSLFPEGKTDGGGSEGSIEGSVGGWKIKAVGAWGAYVTAFLLGFWTIKTTAIPLIKTVGGASVWMIDSDFQFTDENGKPVTDTVDNLQVLPPMVDPWGTEATIKVFSENQDPPDDLKITLAGYEKGTPVPLKGVPVRDGRIKLPTITLKRVPALKSSSPQPTPMPAGQGPPVVTSNQ
jgi:hypothetical protein